MPDLVASLGAVPLQCIIYSFIWPSIHPWNPLSLGPASGMSIYLFKLIIYVISTHLVRHIILPGLVFIYLFGQERRARQRRWAQHTTQLADLFIYLTPSCPSANVLRPGTSPPANLFIYLNEHVHGRVVVQQPGARSRRIYLFI